MVRQRARGFIGTGERLWGRSCLLAQSRLARLAARCTGCSGWHVHVDDLEHSSESMLPPPRPSLPARCERSPPQSP